MTWLARLKNQKTTEPHATKPTKPPEGDQSDGFVGFVAPVLALTQKTQGEGRPTDAEPVQHGKVTERLTTDPAKDAGNGAKLMKADPPVSPLPEEPDRWCWPNSPAWNGAEIDLFIARAERFSGKGLSMDDAERLADKLVIRDRDGDERRLCLECAYLHGAGRWRCGNSERAEVVRAGLAPDLVLTLQRCPGFRQAGT